MLRSRRRLPRRASGAYLTCVLIDPENNKEAAARIRMMQDHGAVSSSQTAPLANQLGNQLANQYSNQSNSQQQQQQMRQQPQQQMMQAAPPQTMQAPQQYAAPNTAPQANASGNDTSFHKNMYEGGNGAGSMQASSQLGFRTHDESSEAQALEQQRAAAMEQQRIAQANQAQAAASGVNDSLSKVTDAEAQRDYNTAISLLRDVSANNLQNPEIHHRLAVNLLASGQISEAISEFRIASALNPTKGVLG